VELPLMQREVCGPLGGEQPDLLRATNRTWFTPVSDNVQR
jgi:hypothetical protein